MTLANLTFDRNTRSTGYSKPFSREAQSTLANYQPPKFQAFFLGTQSKRKHCPPPTTSCFTFPSYVKWKWNIISWVNSKGLKLMVSLQILQKWPHGEWSTTWTSLLCMAQGDFESVTITLAKVSNDDRGTSSFTWYPIWVTPIKS